jgi:hypothetical protein
MRSRPIFFYLELLMMMMMTTTAMTDAHVARRLAIPTPLRICRRDKNMLPPPTSRREETSTNLFLLLFLLLDDTNKYSAVTKLVVFVDV